MIGDPEPAVFSVVRRSGLEVKDERQRSSLNEIMKSKLDSEILNIVIFFWYLVKEGSLQTTIINIDPHSVVREYDKRIVSKNAIKYK